MALIDPCLYLQADAHPARSFRQLITAVLGEGILGSTSFAVTERGAGANFSVDVAAGMGIVTGDSAAQQGRYLVVNDATVNDATTVITSAPSAGNERYDRVILEVKDNAEDAGGINAPRFRVVAGTPAALGTASAPALPNTAITLAIIGPIVNGTTTITNSLITDGRTHARLAQQVADTAAIVDANVTTAKIADLNVTTGKLADAAVTNAKLASNVPLGTMGYAQRTDSQTVTGTSETAITSMTVTFTAVAGRRYRARYYCASVNPDGTSARVRLKQSSTVLQTAKPSDDVAAPALVMEYVNNGSISGSLTWSVHCINSLAGSGTTFASIPTSESVGVQFLIVEDIGAL